MSDDSKIHELGEKFKKWVRDGSPTVLEGFNSEPSKDRMPTNWRFLGIAVGVIMFFSAASYQLGGKDISTARSIDVLTVEVAGLSKIVGPIPNALDSLREQVEELRDEVVRLQSSQAGYDIELAKTKSDLDALEKILINNISSGDNRSIDLFNDLNIKVSRNEGRLGTLRKDFGIAHP